MTDYVPVYDEDGNLKHYQTTDPEFSSVEAKDSFTDPGGKIHTGKIGGGGGGIEVLARYSTDATHSGDSNGIIILDGASLTLNSTQVSDGDFYVLLGIDSTGSQLADTDGAPFYHEGTVYDPSSGSLIGPSGGEMAWVVWDGDEGRWEVSGDCFSSP